MTTTPAGSPAWCRSNTADTYGGIATKRDLGGIGKVNAKTDVGTADWLRMAADCAAAVHAAPLFWARITVAFATNVSVTSATVQPMWGPVETYSTTPPSDYYPTFSNNAPQLFLTFPNCTVTDTGGIDWLEIPDEYGVNGRCQIEMADAGSVGAVVGGSFGTEIQLYGTFTTGRIITLVAY
jgi:hypothetical protein